MHGFKYFACNFCFDTIAYLIQDVKMKISKFKINLKNALISARVFNLIKPYSFGSNI